MMKTYRWIAVIILTFMLSLSVSAVNAQTLPQGTASISLTAPTPNPAATSREISFDIIISANYVTPGLTAADIYVKYDSALVEPPASPNSVAEAIPDFFGTSNNISSIELTQCPGSTDSCAHLITAGAAQVTHSGVVARLHFMGKAAGNACFSVVQSLLANANGTPVPNSQAPQAVCVNIDSTAGTVNAAILRQGTPATISLGGGTSACTAVSARARGTEFNLSNTDKDGKFSLGKLEDGTYFIWAAYPGYLDSRKSGVVVADGKIISDFGATTLRGGDINGDDVINILDVRLIIRRFNWTNIPVRSASINCSNVDDEPADINDDGIVNISDLAIVSGNLGLKGPTIWQP